MAFLDLPDFEARQILTAAELDQLIAALEGFSAQAGDIAWPLICQGNIDFDNLYTVSNLNTLWSVVNAEEYDDLTAAIAALDSGGGAIFIPPNATIKAEAAEVTMNNVHIFGAGPDSVIQVENAPTSAITTTADITDFSIKNLTIDGDGDNATLIQLNGVTRFSMDSVYLKDSIAPAFLQMDKGSAADTNACRDISVTNCEFYGVATTAHILATDIEGAYFGNIISESSGGNGFRGDPDGATSKMKNIKLDNWRIDTPGAEGVYIVGDNATSSVLWARNEASNVTVHDSVTVGIQMGFASGMLQDTTILGARVYDAGTDGIIIDTDNGLVDGYYIEGSGAYALDQLLSTNLVIGSGQALNSTTGDFTAGMKHIGPFLSTDSTHRSIGTATDFGYALTIPANTVKIGDVVRIKAAFVSSAGASGITVRCLLETVDIGTTAAFAASINVWAEWDCHVVAMSGADSTFVPWMYVWNEGATRASAARSDQAIDWTADVDVTFAAGAITGGTVAIRGITVEILGGV